MAFNPTIPAYSTQGKSFSRTAAFPLEGYEIWTDLEALKAYAANTDPAKDPSYIGQKVAYIDYEGGRVVHYGIEIDGSLKELGADKMGVEALRKEHDRAVPQAFYVIDTPASGEEGAEDYQPEVGHVEIRWVQITATDTLTKIKSTDGSVIVTTADGADNEIVYDLSIVVPDVPEYTIVKNERGEGEKFTSYNITKDNVKVGETIIVPDLDTFNSGDMTDADAEVVDVVYGISASGDNTHTIDYITHKVVTPKGLAAAIAKAEVGKLTKVIADSVTADGKVVVKGETIDPAEHVIYMVKVAVETGDAYKEYMVIEGALVQIGDTTTDLSNYVETGDIGKLAKLDYVSSIRSGDTEDIQTDLARIIAHKSGLDIAVGSVDINIGTDVGGQVKISAPEGLVELTNNDIEGNESKIQLEGGEVRVTADSGFTVNGKTVATLDDIPAVPAIEIAESQALEAATANTIAVLAGLEADEHTITPKTIEVATAKGLGDLADLVGAPADGDNVADGLYGELAALALVVDGKVDTVTAVGANKDGVRFINQTEINKLAALNLDGEEITISGSVNASQVKELDPRIVDIVTGTGTYVISEAVGEEGEEGYIPAVLGNKLAIEKGAQVNKIESIGLPDATLAIADKHVAIPAFIEGKYGVIKGAAVDSINTVIAQADGTGKVEKVSTDTLVQGDDEFILNGGNASLTKA